MPRKVKEWIGKTDDTMPPPSVRLRIFEQHGGRCRLTGKKILAGDKWDLDHIVPLADGGENRESNLAPVLHFAHQQKTTKENKTRAKAKRNAIKHFGMTPKKPKSRFKRRMDGTVVFRDTGEPVGRKNNG